MNAKTDAQPHMVAHPSENAPTPLPRVGYSIEEAAEILGVSRITLLRELSGGGGPASFTVRRRRLFTLQALEEYALNRQCANGVTPRAVPAYPTSEDPV